jgi:DNA-directed RNA polymerase specialized sigma subunit
MDDRDVELRNLTYRLFVGLGRAPRADEVAEAVGATREEVMQAWRRLHEAHALVLEPGGTEIRMANPSA